MIAFHQLNLQGQSFCLSSERSIYWEEQKTLIVSDLHLGKSGHFRKAGIAVPQSVFWEDIQRLVGQLQYFSPARLVVVGDMFHSSANKELDLFLKWRRDLSSIDIQLVVGNHDILHKDWYKNADITISEPSLKIGAFCFQHDAGDCVGEEDAGTSFVFSGHIHPGVSISGLGRQRLRFPCFYFTANQCILPAFSHFTGTVNIVPKTTDKIFAIVNRTIMEIN